MRLLLDTHTFIWFVMGSPQLSASARLLIEDPLNQKYVSDATVWEMAIKHSLGKLNLQQPFRQFIERHMAGNGFDRLVVNYEHFFRTAGLPYHHRDPFDRMLIAQALVEQMPVVSIDSIFDQYAAQRLW